MITVWEPKHEENKNSLDFSWKTPRSYATLESAADYSFLCLNKCELISYTL